MTGPMLSLVNKDFPVGATPRNIDHLDAAVAAAVVASLVDGSDDETVDRVADMLVTWSDEGRWLVCHCLGDRLAAAPVLAPRVSVSKSGHGNDSCTLVRLSGRRSAHALTCKFHGARGAAPRAIRADRGPRMRVTALGVLGGAHGGSVHGGGLRVMAHESRAPRVPGLARVLFTLLEAAGLNRWPSGAVGHAAERKRLNDTIASQTARFFMLPGQKVAAGPWVRTSLSELGDLGDALVRARQTRAWPARSRPHGLIIDLVEEVIDEGGALMLAPAYGPRVRIRGRVRIPGQGTPGPFVAILLVVVPPGGAAAEVTQAYLHPAYRSGTHLLVDSDLERRTMETLASLRETGPAVPAKMSIRKPLTDHPTFNVRPDFVLSWNNAHLVVETMGYSTDEYLGRKAQVHQIMGRIGRVIEDRPGVTPLTDEVGDAFGWIKNDGGPHE